VLGTKAKQEDDPPTAKAKVKDEEREKVVFNGLFHVIN